MSKKSIIPNGDWWRNTRFTGSHEHHVFGGANRKHSDIDGLVIYTLPMFHTGPDGVHFNKARDLEVKKIAQKCWMDYYKRSKEDFIKRYKKNWLDDDEI